MERLVDDIGTAIRLTDERRGHILKHHADMQPYINRLGEVLAKPDLITHDDRRSLDIHYYHRRLRDHTVCVVVKITPNDAWIVTAHIIGRIRGKKAR